MHWNFVDIASKHEDYLRTSPFARGIRILQKHGFDVNDRESIIVGSDFLEENGFQIEAEQVRTMIEMMDYNETKEPPTWLK